MANLREYSLASHSLSLKTPTRNLIIGNGSAVESMAVSFTTDNFSYTISADGSYTLNKNYILDGTITVTLQATNPFVDELTNMYKEQLQYGSTNVATAILKDSNGSVNGTFSGCVISKYPDYTAANEVGTRAFTIKFGNGILN